MSVIRKKKEINPSRKETLPRFMEAGHLLERIANSEKKEVIYRLLD